MEKLWMVYIVLLQKTGFKSGIFYIITKQLLILDGDLGCFFIVTKTTALSIMI